MNESYGSVTSIYDFTVKDLHNNDYKLSQYDNHQVLLIVNFATNDDLAEKNFLELKDLKQRFGDGETRSVKEKFEVWKQMFTDISILLFPCCQFGDPMPEREDSEIYCWCKFEGIEFGKVFSMVDNEKKTYLESRNWPFLFPQVDVIGPNAHPLFQYLTQEKPPVRWNFTKFLVNNRGQVVEQFNHEAPFDKIESSLKLLL